MRFKAKKKGMTQIYNKNGKIVPVTVVEVIEEINFEDISENDEIKVTGATRGRGFAGVVKRYAFAGGPKTHGQSDRHRATGSIGGGSTPGRVWMGKKMPGHYGNEIKTITGLSIVKVEKDKKLVVVSGSIPGARKNIITVEVINEGK